MRVVLTYWEASGEVSELSYKSLLYSTSVGSYCTTSRSYAGSIQCNCMWPNGYWKERWREGGWQRATTVVREHWISRHLDALLRFVPFEQHIENIEKWITSDLHYVRNVKTGTLVPEFRVGKKFLAEWKQINTNNVIKSYCKNPDYETYVLILKQKVTFVLTF